MRYLDDTFHHPLAGQTEGGQGGNGQQTPELLAFLRGFDLVVYLVGHGSRRQILCLGENALCAWRVLLG